MTHADNGIGPTLADGIEPVLDHLVYATPDLAGTVAEFTARTGITPAEGGRHLGRGTRNVLVGLGPTAYLEIIGPDLDHPAMPGSSQPFGIAALTGPRLVTWAVHPSAPDDAVGRAAAAGLDLGPLRPMSRRTPAGAVLSWRLTAADQAPFDGVVPFVIDWGATAHPAADPGLPQARLTSFTGTHPDPDRAAAGLRAIGARLGLAAGPAGLRAVLDTPGGPVVLT